MHNKDFNFGANLAWPGRALRSVRFRSQTRALSLVEVAVSMAVLSAVILGATKSLEGAAHIQSVTKERQAASLAAAAQLNDLVLLGSTDEVAWNNLDNWNQTGFPVTLQAGSVGVSGNMQTATTTATGSLPPALTTSARWPATRAGAGGATQAQPGFIEVQDVAGRDGLKQITITVAWRSVSTGDDVIVFTQFLANPEL
jgi:type II secretory pathway pseudopilin PulG